MTWMQHDRQSLKSHPCLLQLMSAAMSDCISFKDMEKKEIIRTVCLHHPHVTQDFTTYFLNFWERRKTFWTFISRTFLFVHLCSRVVFSVTGQLEDWHFRHFTRDFFLWDITSLFRLTSGSHDFLKWPPWWEVISHYYTVKSNILDFFTIWQIQKFVQV